MIRQVTFVLVGALLSGCGFAQNMGVTVVGTTATQAVLEYTAPTEDPCTLAVSESPSLVPVVHDVDPTLFRDANFDNRPGSVNRGRRRAFVIGERTAEVALNGNRVSRALQVFTPHFFRIPCGSSDVTGSFTTANASVEPGAPAGMCCK